MLKTFLQEVPLFSCIVAPKYETHKKNGKYFKSRKQKYIKSIRQFIITTDIGEATKLALRTFLSESTSSLWSQQTKTPTCTHWSRRASASLFKLLKEQEVVYSLLSVHLFLPFLPAPQVEAHTISSPIGIWTSFRRFPIFPIKGLQTAMVALSNYKKYWVPRLFPIVLLFLDEKKRNSRVENDQRKAQVALSWSKRDEKD